MAKMLACTHNVQAYFTQDKTATTSLVNPVYTEVTISYVRSEPPAEHLAGCKLHNLYCVYCNTPSSLYLWYNTGIKIGNNATVYDIALCADVDLSGIYDCNTPLPGIILGL